MASVYPGARPLDPDEPCPTLHRYPGPCGLALWFAGKLERLAPADLLWMSELPVVEDSYGARLFGTLAVRDPHAFAPAIVSPGIYVARNRPLRAADEIEWLAPRGRDRAGVIDELCRYLEELDALRATGAPGPGIPWCRVPVEERRRTLAHLGVVSVWTESDCWYNAVP